MRPEAFSYNSCRASGVILTCYVDGHKRFRSVPVIEEADEASPRNSGGDSETGDCGTARFAVPVRRNRRAN